MTERDGPGEGLPNLHTGHLPRLDRAVQHTPISRFSESILFVDTNEVLPGFSRGEKPGEGAGSHRSRGRGRVARGPSSTAMPAGGTRTPSSVCASAGTGRQHLLLPGTASQGLSPEDGRQAALLGQDVRRGRSQMASSASDCRSPGPCGPNQDTVYALPSHLCPPLPMCMFMARRGVKLQSAPLSLPGPSAPAPHMFTLERPGGGPGRRQSRQRTDSGKII